MALIKCPECGKEVSSVATFCPHCGFPNPANALAHQAPQNQSTQVKYVSTSDTTFENRANCSIISERVPINTTSHQNDESNQTNTKDAKEEPPLTDEEKNLFVFPGWWLIGLVLQTVFTVWLGILLGRVILLYMEENACSIVLFFVNMATPAFVWLWLYQEFTYRFPFWYAAKTDMKKARKMIEDRREGKRKAQLEQKKIEEERWREAQKHIYICPQCGQKAGRPISAFSKTGSVYSKGLASETIGKNYKCSNCDYIW